MKPVRGVSYEEMHGVQSAFPHSFIEAMSHIDMKALIDALGPILQATKVQRGKLCSLPHDIRAGLSARIRALPDPDLPT
jgi:hypothetical protein